MERPDDPRPGAGNPLRKVRRVEVSLQVDIGEPDGGRFCRGPIMGSAASPRRKPLDQRDRPANWDIPPPAPPGHTPDRDLKPLGSLPADSAFEALISSASALF